MNLQGKNIVLTGAAGGIGSELARALAVAGARLVLVDRKEGALQAVTAELKSQGFSAAYVVADLSRPEQLAGVVEQSLAALGSVDVLINLAGLMGFRAFAHETDQETALLFQLNVISPMQLTRLVLPHMQTRGSGLIVNVGSVFGSIGFAWFTTYSATKAALQKFSEALRRELAGTGVGVCYVAPRAVRTPFNTDAIYGMAEKTGMHLDEPGWVAARIVDCIVHDRKERYLGFPESWFVRLNGLLPRLIDSAVRKQNRTAGEFANRATDCNKP